MSVTPKWPFPPGTLMQLHVYFFNLHDLITPTILNDFIPPGPNIPGTFFSHPFTERPSITPHKTT